MIQWANRSSGTGADHSRLLLTSSPMIRTSDTSQQVLDSSSRSRTIQSSARSSQPYFISSFGSPYTALPAHFSPALQPHTHAILSIQDVYSEHWLKLYSWARQKARELSLLSLTWQWLEQFIANWIVRTWKWNYFISISDSAATCKTADRTTRPLELHQALPASLCLYFCAHPHQLCYCKCLLL